MSEQHKLLEWMYACDEKQVAIASVIHVEGSAYRHQGAQMIIGAKGNCSGMISGGCLEEDLMIRARSAIQTMTSTIVNYDMRAEDDLGWGKGAGCNGKVYVSIEPMDLNHEKTRDIMAEALRHVQKGETLFRVAGLDDPVTKSPDYYFSSGKGLTEESTALDDDIIRSFQDQRKAPVFLTSSAYDRVLVERIEPKPVVYVFGAGMDAEPLVKHLGSLEFNPVVVDTVKERLNEEIFPEAAGFRWLTPDDFFQVETMPEGSYALVMTHKFQDDLIILNELVKKQKQLAYIGVLGPKKRTRRLLSSGRIPNAVHSPVGLDIGAEGAEEIAISIVAELIQVRRQQRVLTNSEKAVM
ncbi:XdhC family protein [Salisediminibacterium beveridgei]|uniref:Xanthine and CO dehydrogenases maturation factor, XdhC/CoxF family n=1 Tax=Salisediminibacterium beveridgei TaxID=632773 RepID=A0A1D7QYE4_9BACI|nr:XdhC family protein [Salisediminibacterium beveridgei]AOM84031.1 Xanthine and CO dehydrogenases maturation factor, XdhC/CoxF family [Salisediminibacterium beveridgei]